MQSKGTMTAVVAASGTESTAIDMRGKTLLGVQVPTIDAATLKLQASVDGSNFFDLKDTTPTLIGSWGSSTGGFGLDASELARFAGYPFLKIVLGASQTGGARTFNIAVC